MTDWQAATRAEGWTTFTRSVRVQLGTRKRTVHVHEDVEELMFYAEVPQPDTAGLIDMLSVNSLPGLAYWHVDGGHVWAVSRCPQQAGAAEIVTYLKETAALADRLELRCSDKDT